MRLVSGFSAVLVANRFELSDGLEIFGSSRRPFRSDQRLEIEGEKIEAEDGDAHGMPDQSLEGAGAGDLAEQIDRTAVVLSVKFNPFRRVSESN
jgi:hypothetical protein